MNVKYLVHHAIAIQKAHRNWMLCGSLGMILRGLIPVRKVHDLDFVINRSNLNISSKYGDKIKNRIKNQNVKYYNKMKMGYGYVYFKIGIPECCCLFAVNNTRASLVRCEPYANGTLWIQTAEEMIRWKTIFGRDKDIEDIKKSKNNLTLP